MYGRDIGGRYLPQTRSLTRSVLKMLACLVAAFFVINWYFAAFETLLNPILADNFGFDVEYDSYAFLGTLVFFASGLFVL